MALRLALVLAFPVVAAAGNACNFTVKPAFPQTTWDDTCVPRGGLGCLADGRNLQCRFCGGGAYVKNKCGPRQCSFVNDPFVPYYWEPDCKMGMLGCWADGIHSACRFCGSYPYTNISCPNGTAETINPPPSGAACAFAQEPETPYYWENRCKLGDLGCLADGKNVHCRFCGTGDYESIPCPTQSQCTFLNEPLVPYYWDPKCKTASPTESLGCKADGIHDECRFCGKRPFQNVSCPTSLVPAGQCYWVNNSVPTVPFYWEPTCKEGMLGCWADGFHAECRYCGVGAYEGIACPETTTTVAAQGSQAGAAATLVSEEQANAEAGSPAEVIRAGDKGATAEDMLAKDSLSNTATTTQQEIQVAGAMSTGYGIATSLGCFALVVARA